MNRQAEIVQLYRSALAVMVLTVLGGVAFCAGIFFALGSHTAHAQTAAPDKKEPRVVYPKQTNLDFDDAKIEGEIRNPGEFYFQHRPEEKFDSLVKRRKNFHREMLRDVVLSK